MELHPRSKEIIRKLKIIQCEDEKYNSINKILNEAIEHIQTIDLVARENIKNNKRFSDLFKWWESENKIFKGE